MQTPIIPRCTLIYNRQTNSLECLLSVLTALGTIEESDVRTIEQIHPSLMVTNPASGNCISFRFSECITDSMSGQRYYVYAPAQPDKALEGLTLKLWGGIVSHEVVDGADGWKELVTVNA